MYFSDIFFSRYFSKIFSCHGVRDYFLHRQRRRNIWWGYELGSVWADHPGCHHLFAHPGYSTSTSRSAKSLFQGLSLRSCLKKFIVKNFFRSILLINKMSDDDPIIGEFFYKCVFCCVGMVNNFFKLELLIYSSDWFFCRCRASLFFLVSAFSWTSTWWWSWMYRLGLDSASGSWSVGTIFIFHFSRFH